MTIEKIEEKNIDEVSWLAVNCFTDDPYFLALDKSIKRRKEKIYKLFSESIQICINHGYAYGVRNNNRFISFILWFDYNKLKKKHPDEYNFIFGISGKSRRLFTDKNLYINKNVSLACKRADSEGLNVMYLLAMAVDKSFRRNGLATMLLEHIINSFPDYVLFGDVSNDSSIDMYRKLNFEIERVNKDYIFVIHKQKDQFTFNYKDDIYLAVPTIKVLNEVFPARSSQKPGDYFNIEIEGYKTVSDEYIDSFIENTYDTAKAIAIKVSYNELLEYQRYVNLSNVDEKIIKHVKFGCIVLYCKHTDSVNKPLFNENLEQMLATKHKEWETISDIYVSIPIQYSNIDILLKKSDKKYDRNVSFLLDLMNFRTKYESGLPDDSIMLNEDNYSFKQRINRFYLGKLNIEILEEIVPLPYNHQPQRIGQPADVDIFISIDSNSHCGVVTLVSLSCPFIISQYLDSISRNQISIFEDGISHNIFDYFKTAYGIDKQGSPKVYVTVPANRDSFDKRMLASLLFCETVYLENEGMGGVIDDEICDMVQNTVGMGQYEYSTVYAYTNILLQLSERIAGTVRDRMVLESITLFYFELLMFEEAATCTAKSKIAEFLNRRDRYVPIIVLRRINHIFTEYSKTMDFWDVAMNYPSSKKSVSMIREAFKIEAQKAVLERNLKQLQIVFETQKDILDRTEASILNYIILILTIAQIFYMFLPDIFNSSTANIESKVVLLCSTLLVVVLYAFTKKMNLRRKSFLNSSRRTRK